MCAFRTILAITTGLSAFSASPAELTSRFVDSKPGVRIHVQQAGQGGPALLFVPGWRFTAEIWAHQLRHFGLTRRAVAVDPRSQGESTMVREGNTPEGRTADLQAVITALELSPVVLVGWSQGAQDVAAYLQRYGTRELAGVVLVDSPVSAGVEELDLNGDSSRGSLALLGGFAEQPLEYTRGMMPRMFATTRPASFLQHLVDQALKTPTDTAVAMLCSDLFGMDRRPALARIDRPALVVASGLSSSKERQKEMAGKIEGARYVEVEGAGHALFVDQPERFEGLLQEFLATLPPSSPR
jgi:microsomal epoxide hydrolase